MNRIIIIVLIVIANLSIALGQKNATKRAEQEITQIENKRTAAALRGDAEYLKSILAEDYIGTTPGGGVDTKEKVLAEFTSKDVKYNSLIDDEVRIRIYDNTAVVTGRITSKGTYKGDDISNHYRFTRVYIRRAGRWQTVAFQATAITE